MGKAYQSELKQIPATVKWALEQDISDLRQTLLGEFAGYNLLAVGSGGSLVAATFAAMLHESVTGRLARTATPLEATNRPSTRDTAALLLSAGGANPDIRQAARILPTLGYETVSALCTRAGSPLGLILADCGESIHEFPLPCGRDGFLATNSLIATLVLLYRATSSAGSTYGQDPVPPVVGAAQRGSTRALSRRTIIVLAQGWAVPAAVDFETRFSEAALANVTVTDPRNFAHGRHNWLSFHAGDTGIVSLETLESHREASHTLKYIPDGIDILRVKSALKGPLATIDLVHCVMELVGRVAVNQGIDPGRPSVPDFGRRMYRAGSTRHARYVEPAPITKKRMALFLPSEPSRCDLKGAFKDFIQRIGQTSFKGLVLDYDGTLCARKHRFDPLDEEIQAELNRLLDEGILLGVASGGGGSVYDQLKNSIDEKHWKQVVVGLYNGARVVKLCESLPDSVGNGHTALRTVCSRLRPLQAILGFEMVARPHQISLRPAAGPDPYELRAVTTEHLAGINDIMVVASSHSVDVVHTGTSKTAVVDALVPEQPGCVLRIGDQGAVGGNDFDLLNTGLSLSVDRVSSNLETCWYLGANGLSGPHLTLQYLRALRAGCGGFRLDSSLLLPGIPGIKE